MEAGPYRLTSVVVTGGSHKGEAEIGGIPSHPIADARTTLGKPIHVRRDKNVGPPVPPPTLTAEEQAGRDAVLNPARRPDPLQPE